MLIKKVYSFLIYLRIANKNINVSSMWFWPLLNENIVLMWHLGITDLTLNTNICLNVWLTGRIFRRKATCIISRYSNCLSNKYLNYSDKMRQRKSFYNTVLLIKRRLYFKYLNDSILMFLTKVHYDLDPKKDIYCPTSLCVCDMDILLLSSLTYVWYVTNCHVICFPSKYFPFVFYI